MANFDASTRTAGIVKEPWIIAIDGGTTNTRARLLRGNHVLATARRAVGVRDTVLSSPELAAREPAPTGEPAGPQTLASAVRSVIQEVSGWRENRSRADDEVTDGPTRARLVAAGMLSSEVGLTVVPHVLAPAGLDELARASVSRRLPEIDDRPILFIPGVRTPPGAGARAWQYSDVMRGEECETMGAHAALVAGHRLASGERQWFVWPGSHTKLVELDENGRIARSFTSLAGELLQAVAQHTLVASSLPSGLTDALDRDAAAEGAIAAGLHGLGRAAFLVRMAALCGSLDERARASFLVGAVVGDDAAGLSRVLARWGADMVWVGGREPLRSLYTTEIARLTDRAAAALGDPLAEHASALGALLVTERRAALWIDES